MIPAWLAAPLAAGFVVVALYCATSLVVRRRLLDRLAVTEANHVLMAVAMVVMLLPGGMTLVPLALGATVFAVAAGAWGVVQIAGRGRTSVPPLCGTNPLHLLLLNLAMVAMYVVMSAPAHAHASAPATPSTPGTAPMPGMAPMPAMAPMPGMPAAPMPGMDMTSATTMEAPASAIPLLLVAGVCLALTLYLVVHAGRTVVVGARPVAVTGGGSVAGGGHMTGGGPVALGVMHRAAASPGVRSACQAFMSAGMALMLALSLPLAF